MDSNRRPFPILEFHFAVEAGPQASIQPKKVFRETLQ